MNTLVTKRDGSTENFSVEKIKRVVRAAGLTEEKTDELAKQLVQWITESKLTSVTSLVIRDKVLEELKKLDPYAANLFTWYQKTKEKN